MRGNLFAGAQSIAARAMGPRATVVREQMRAAPWSFPSVIRFKPQGMLSVTVVVAREGGLRAAHNDLNQNSCQERVAMHRLLAIAFLFATSTLFAAETASHRELVEGLQRL